MSGTVFAVYIKPHVEGESGLPKWPIPEAKVTVLGVEGDYNHYRRRKHGNTPERALLLMPYETLQEINSDGWNVRPGDMGENIATLGVPYNEMQPGKQYRIGEVEIQISEACTPCKNLYEIVGEGQGPKFLKALLNRRGWYARVLKEGAIRPGDSIEELL